MKSKIIKKMLATIIAASTIIATPSLAIATKKLSGQNPAQPKNDGQTNRKKKNVNRNRNGGFTRSNNKKVKIINPQYQHAWAKLRNAFKKSLYTSEEKIDLVQTINTIIENDWTSGWRKTSMYKLIEILGRCINEPAAREHIANAMASLTSDYFIRPYSPSEISKMVRLLQTLSSDGNFKEQVAQSVNNLTYNYLLKDPGEYAKKDVSIMINMLFESLDNEAAKTYIAKSVGELSFLGFLENLSQDDVSRLTNALINYQINDPELKANVTFAIANLAFNHAFSSFSPDQISTIVDTLIGCADSLDAQKYFANAIVGLLDDELFKKIPENKIIEITNKLKQLSNNNTAKKYVALAISRLAYYNLLRGYDDQKMSEIAETLIKCASNEEAKKHVAIAIANLEQDNFLKKYPKSEILKITDSILNFNDNMVYDDVDRIDANNIGFLIFELARKDLLNEYSDEEIAKMVDLLISRLYELPGETQEGVASAIAKLASQGLLDKYCQEKTQDILNVLFNCAEDKADSTKKNVAEAISQLAKRGFLKTYNHAEILKIFQFLDQLAKDSKQAQEGVLDAILEMAKNNLFDQFTEYDISSIFNLICTSAQNKSALNKGKVANIIYELISKNLLEKCSKETMSAFLNLLQFCSEGNCCHEVVEGGVKSVQGDRKYIAQTFKFLNDKDFFYNHDKDSILQIINSVRLSVYEGEAAAKDVAYLIFKFSTSGALKKCSESEIQDINEILIQCAKHSKEAQKYVAETIKTFVFDDMFKGYSKINIWNVIQIILKCCYDDDPKTHLAIADAIYGLVKSGSLNQQLKFPLYVLEYSLDKCAEVVGYDNDNINDALDELHKIMPTKKAQF